MILLFIINIFVNNNSQYIYLSIYMCENNIYILHNYIRSYGDKAKFRLNINIYTYIYMYMNVVCSVDVIYSSPLLTQKPYPLINP